MAVYTEVPFDEAAGLVARLNIGTLTTLRGCPGGIENTNYFADTTGGRYVLTVFERLGFEQLPFYLQLMQHLARHGIAVPAPQADADGCILHRLLGKPAAVVERLRGSHRLAPDQRHCAVVGAALARMHLAALDFPLQQPNLRSLGWWIATVPVVLPHLAAPQRELIESELALQRHVAESAAFAALPRGPIHADLFRDNVMFEAADEPAGHDQAAAVEAGSSADRPADEAAHAAGPDRLGGFFDFYFAGVDCLLFDIAVCLNDWCIALDTGVLDETRAQAFVAAYDAVRPLCGDELRLLPTLMRGAALRFWLSRLWDLHLPREASVLTAHDPAHFERVLRQRVEQPWHFLRDESQEVDDRDGREDGDDRPRVAGAAPAGSVDASAPAAG